MRDALNTKRTRRYIIGTVFTGRTVRTADAVATVAAQVAAGSLTTIDGASFGLFSIRDRRRFVQITRGAATLTSPNNPWTAATSARRSTSRALASRAAPCDRYIAAYTSAGSITLWHERVARRSPRSCRRPAAWPSGATSKASPAPCRCARTKPRPRSCPRRTPARRRSTRSARSAMASPTMPPRSSRRSTPGARSASHTGPTRSARLAFTSAPRTRSSTARARCSRRSRRRSALRRSESSWSTSATSARTLPQTA
jgi:hypothetical protein